MEKKRRKRTGEYRSGDIVRARIGKDRSIHTCVILDDYNKESGEVPCMKFCNFTGTPVGNNMIDVSEFNLPWFGTLKQNTWIRCEETDCLRETDIVANSDNIKETHPHVWSIICEESFSCSISDRLKKACDCDYDLIQKQIDLKGRVKPDCGCNQMPVKLSA